MVHLKGSLVSKSSIQGFLYKDALESEEEFLQKYEWLKQQIGKVPTQIDPEKSELGSPLLDTEIVDVIRDHGVLKCILKVLSSGEDFEQMMKKLEGELS